ncbi:MAG: cytochrome c oxidase assembly protein [Pseudomonadota bacterium]
MSFIPAKGSNQRTALFCATFAAGMLGMAFAAVPLYRLFCQVTGFGGTTQRVEQVAERVLERTIKVRFDAQAAGSLGWQFKPKVREVELKLGEATTMEYFAKNVGLDTSTGEATFNVTPNNAGAYFNKLECFCFTETELASGESMDMPVYFFIDPDVANNSDLDNLTTITLSYTFFPVDNPTEQVAKAVVTNTEAGTNTASN